MLPFMLDTNLKRQLGNAFLAEILFHKFPYFAHRVKHWAAEDGRNKRHNTQFYYQIPLLYDSSY